MPRGEGGVGLPDLGVTSTAMLAKMLAQLWSPRVRPWQPLTHSLLTDPSHGLSTWVITDPTAPPSRGISPRLQAHVAALAELKLFRAVPPASQSFFSVLAEPLWYNAQVRMNPAAREAAAEQGWTHVRHVREALHSPQLEGDARWAADLVRACLPEPWQGMVDCLQPPQPEWECLRVGPGVGFVMRRTPLLQPSHWVGPNGRLYPLDPTGQGPLGVFWAEGGAAWEPAAVARLNKPSYRLTPEDRATHLRPLPAQHHVAQEQAQGQEQGGAKAEEWLLGPWAHLQLDPQVWGMGTTTLLDFSVKHARVRLHQLQRVSADPLHPPSGGLWPALWGVRPPWEAGVPEVAAVADGALRELELKWEASVQQVAGQGAAGEREQQGRDVEERLPEEVQGSQPPRWLDTSARAHHRPSPQDRAAQQAERQLEAQQRRGGRQPAPRADTADQLAVGFRRASRLRSLMVGALWGHILKGAAAPGSSACRFCQPGHLETLTHAFLTCPAVAPAWEWVLDVYGRLTGTRPPSGDAMLLLSGRPTRGEAPPFQPPDSLLWLRLRVAYLGAVWRLRSSGAASALQPQQVARRVVEEVISTLITAVKRDWHRVGWDIRVGLCGAVPSTWFKGKDPELDAAHFDQLWPEASGACTYSNATVCVYAPAQQAERPAFYAECLPACLPPAADRRLLLMGGDFNCILAPVDRVGIPQGSQHGEAWVGNRGQGAEQLRQLVGERGLVDPWRHLHPSKRDLTHFSERWQTGARLDRWYISEELVQWQMDSAIQGVLPVPTDHRPVSVAVCPPDLPLTVPAPWQLHPAHLDNPDLLDCLKDFLQAEALYHEAASQLGLPRDGHRARWARIKQGLAMRAQHFLRAQRRAQRDLQQRREKAAAVARAHLVRQLVRVEREGEAEVQAAQHLGEAAALAGVGAREQGAQQSLLASAVLDQYYGDRSSFYFYHRDQPAHTPTLNSSLQLPGQPGQPADLTTPAGVKAACRAFQQHYSAAGPTGVYAAKPVDTAARAALLGSLTSHLTPTQARAAEGPDGSPMLSEEELGRALQGCAHSKAPGLDGLPMEVYDRLWVELGRPLRAMLREALADTADPAPLAEFLTGIITLVPKAGKPRDQVAGYRPITLLNCDVRLVARTVEDWLQLLVDLLVSPSQSAFILGRDISDSVQFHLGLLEYLHQRGSPAWLLLLDLAGAYDNVSWGLLQDTMEAMGFCREGHVRWAQLLHRGATSQEYADDLTIVVLDRVRDGKVVVEALGLFRAAGGPALSVSKSSALPCAQPEPGLGNQGGSGPEGAGRGGRVGDGGEGGGQGQVGEQGLGGGLGEGGGLGQQQGGREQGGEQEPEVVIPAVRAGVPVRHLGVPLGAASYAATSEAAFGGAAAAMMAASLPWRPQGLNLLGRVQVAQQCLASKSIYQMAFVQPSAPLAQAMALAVNRFVAASDLPQERSPNNSRLYPSKAICVMPRGEGGVGLPDLGVTSTAMLAKMLAQLWSPRVRPWQPLTHSLLADPSHGLSTWVITDPTAPPSRGISPRLQAHVAALAELKLFRAVPPASQSFFSVLAEPLWYNAQGYSAAGPTGVYAAKPVDTAARAALLGSLTSHLTPTQARAAEGPDGSPMLSEEELGRALQGCAHSKAPGLDGLPMEVYDRLWVELGRPLRAMLREALADTADPAPLAEFLTGIITLVPKAGKPRDQVAGYRPITLLNCDVRLVARAVEDRLQLPLDLLVSPSQSAFILGRDISDSVPFHLGLLEYLQQRGSPAWLLLLDLAGAYDNVSWGLLQDTMEAMGFCREGHVRWAQLLHRGATSQVLVNGHLTDSFPLASGLLQGSGASPLYWCIVLQPLVSYLSSLQLAGLISIPTIPSSPLAMHRAALTPALPSKEYADDLTIVVLDRVRDGKVVVEALGLFSAAGGPALSVSKSSALPCAQPEPGLGNQGGSGPEGAGRGGRVGDGGEGGGQGQVGEQGLGGGLGEGGGLGQQQGGREQGGEQEPEVVIPAVRAGVPVRHLGVPLGAASYAVTSEAAFGGAAAAMMAASLPWRPQGLNLLGRVQVAQQCLASKSIYQMAFVQPSAPLAQAMALAVNRFVAASDLPQERSPNNSRLYPSKAICVMPRGEGGVGLPDLGVTSTAMLAKMLAQLWSPRVRPWQPLTHSLLADPSHGLSTWVITDPTAPPSRGISPRLQAHVAALAELKLFRAVPPASQSFFSVLAEPLWYNAQVRMNPAAREAAAEQGWTHVRHVREALHSPQLEGEARWAADLVRACLPEPWQGMVDRLQPPQPDITWRKSRLKGRSKEEPGRLAGEGGGQGGGAGAGGEGVEEVEGEEWLLGPWAHLQLDAQVWGMGTTTLLDFSVTHARVRLHQLLRVSADPLYPPGGGLWPALWGVRPPRAAGEPELAAVADGALRELELKWEASVQQVAGQGAAGEREQQGRDVEERLPEEVQGSQPPRWLDTSARAHQRPSPQMRAAQQAERQLEAQQRRGGRQPVAQPAPRADTADQLAVGVQAGQPCAKVWKELLDPTLRREHVIVAWRVLHASLMVGALWGHILKGTAAPGSSACRFCQPGHLETLTHAFLTCPAVVPAWEWVLDVYGRLTGTRPPSGDVMLLLSGRPTRGEAPPFQPPDSLLWLRLRVAYMGAVWRLRSSGAATALQPQQVARRVVEEVISTLTTAVKRDWHRVGRDIRVDLCGAVPSTWFKGKDPELDAAHFDQLWPEASGA
ncbi:hypothetical protein QJQ45_003007 [Haematococcus lacustris]|nr:hypothetical protein QJQ45_003007 [Haematococcus lacustris]